MVGVEFLLGNAKDINVIGNGQHAFQPFNDLINMLLKNILTFLSQMAFVRSGSDQRVN